MRPLSSETPTVWLWPLRSFTVQYAQGQVPARQFPLAVTKITWLGFHQNGRTIAALNWTSSATEVWVLI